jgi:hypothetical protein
MGADRSATGRRWIAWAGWGLAWAWTFVAGVGGLSLLFTRGPWPLTNGWFALASAVSACPLTARLVGRISGRRLTGLMRFALAAGFYLAGHAAKVLGGQSAF